MTIVFDSVDKRYGRREVLNGVSFACEPGSVTGLLGPNGAGKSTLIRCLLGLTRLSGGTSTIDGIRVASMHQPQRQVGAVLDPAAHHPGRSARHTIEICAGYLSLPRQDAGRMLEYVGLGDAGAKPFRALSLGMKQRLAIVERILSAIEQESGTRIDSETRHVARLYALTHDVSHIASGHTIEDELGFFERHDQNQGRYDRLLSGDSELGKLLQTSEWGREVLRLLNPATSTDDRGVVDDMVSGVLGADVLDYIDRDSLNCGLDHRVDSAIYRQIRMHLRESPNTVLYSHEGGKYGVRADRHFAVENLLAERYALFLKVYTHSAKIAADAVLSKALTLRKKSIKESDFEWFGDDSLMHWLEKSTRNPLVPSLAKRLRGRDLPRGVYRARVLDSDIQDQNNHNMYRDMQARLKDAGWLEPAGRARFENEVSKKSGVATERLFFYLPAQAPGYKRTELWATESANVSPLKSESSESGALARRHLGLWQAWMFVADADPTEKMRVAEAAELLFNRANMIDRYRQSLFTEG